MTMFPVNHHLSSSKYVHGGFSEGGYDCFISLGRGFCSDLMADDDQSRTGISIDNEEPESSMKDGVNLHDDDDDHGRWLQLSLGGGYTPSSVSQQRSEIPPPVDLCLHIRQPSSPQPLPPQLIFQVPEFRGLDHRPTSTDNLFLQPHQTATAINSVRFLTFHQEQQHQQQQQQQQQQLQEINYNFVQLIRPFSANIMMTTTPFMINPTVSSSFSGSSEQQGRTQNVHRRLNVARVVNPPRRLHSGVWFMLQASQNQAKEPFLPQIQKSYLRIKDGKMTIGLLIKYLANKLQLGSESEIEITCKGQKLVLSSTLQHVRDTIWNSSRTDIGFTVVPQSPATVNHLMVLNYGRVA